jgi:alcohol dehydrogenase class IV
MLTLDPLARQHWTLPIPIDYGPGARDGLPALCRRHGMTRPLLVTDRGSKALPFVGELLDRMRAAGLAPALHGEIEPNPTDRGIALGAAAFRAHRADGVIALGGGSGQDGGKGIVLLARQERHPLFDFVYGEPPPAGLGVADFPPLITIPTTAGTGAETESTAMVTDTAAITKRCVWHPLARPAAAILDPELTLGLPPKLTAWTGCDALVHALEAYLVPQFQPLCDGAALQALALIWPSLERAVSHGDDLAARGRMLAGSCLAGVAFLKGLGLVHAISHNVGAAYDAHHGLTNAVLLPAVLRFNRPVIEDRIGPITQALGLPDGRFDTLYAAICGLLDRLGIPKGLAALGARPEDARVLAERSHRDGSTPTNPRPATVADIEALVAQSMTAAR